MSRDENSRKLLRSMTEVDDTFIQEAEEFGHKQAKRKKTKVLSFHRGVGIAVTLAACLALVGVSSAIGGSFLRSDEQYGVPSADPYNSSYMVSPGASDDNASIGNALISASADASSDTEGGTADSLSKSVQSTASSYGADDSLDGMETAAAADADGSAAAAEGVVSNADTNESADSDGAVTGKDDTSSVSSTGTAEEIQKKIIYTGDVTVETKAYETARSQLSDLISQYGGFVESSNEYDSGSDTRSQRSYYVTARIPSEKFNDFLQGLSAVSGKVTSQNISSSDMTRSYSDNADRIEALETEQKTLLELLSKADSVDAMIAIQKELTDVRAELAQLHHANSGIDYDVQYSTVNVSLDEVVSYTPATTSFADRFRDALGQSGQAFLRFLQSLAVGLVFLAPYLVIILVVVLIVRASRKRKGKRSSDS